MTLLSDTFKDHLVNPRNLGEMAGAHGTGEVTGPECGDMMTMYIKVADGRITDISFKTFGCWAAIAASSMVTEIARGMTLAEAGQISRRDLDPYLAGLPEDKIHCIELGISALHRAIRDYERRRTAIGEETKTP